MTLVRYYVEVIEMNTKIIRDAARYVGIKAKEAYDILKPESMTDTTLAMLGGLGEIVIYGTQKILGTPSDIAFPPDVLIEGALPFAAIYVAKKVRESHIKNKQKTVSEEFMNEMIDKLNENGALIEKPDKYDGRRVHSAYTAPKDSCFSDGVIDLQLRPQTSYRKKPEIGYSLRFRGNTSLEEIMQTKATTGKSKGTIDSMLMTTLFPEDMANELYNAVNNYSEMRRKFKNEIDKAAELQSEIRNIIEHPQTKEVKEIKEKKSENTNWYREEARGKRYA